MNRTLCLRGLTFAVAALLGLETALAQPERPPARTNSRSPGSQEGGYNAETLRQFSQRVQPLLLNTCGTGACHGGPNNGGFELVRGGLVQGINANLTRQNLEQTLRLVNHEEHA